MKGAVPSSDWNPARQSRIRAPEAISKTTRRRDDDMFVTGNDYDVAFHHSLHQADGSEDFFRTPAMKSWEEAS